MEQTNPQNLALEKAVNGKVIYLLALIVLVQFAYPVTYYGILPDILYQILYASMIVVGVVVGRDSRRHMLILGGTGLLYLAAGTFYSFNPTDTRIILITYISLIPYEGMLVYVLARYLLSARKITRDVLYSAVAIYLLLGAVLVPLYGILNYLVPDSFKDASLPGGVIQWQQLVYYSYTTLTSTGYGDILPVSAWGRSLANLEMITGVMFITIVMARLVSIYTSEKE